MGKQYVMGIDMGTNSVRVGIYDLKGEEISFSVTKLTTYREKNGWAEQSEKEWWEALGNSSRNAIAQSKIEKEEIIGLSFDTTSCTVVFCDKKGETLRRPILWMDVRATEEAEIISNSQEDVLRINGYGNTSPEWMVPKAMWMKKHEPQIYRDAEVVCECSDWLGYKLTDHWACNINNITFKWYYDREFGGWPLEFYDRMGLVDLQGKFPQEILELGEVLGGLSKEAAIHLGLNEGTSVGQGGIDSLVGMIGLGVVEEGSSTLITGTSHLLFSLTDKSIHQKGIWGTYTDALITGTNVIEGSQISTGSIISWFIEQLCQDLVEKGMKEGKSIFDYLDAEAKDIPAGSDGLIMTDFWQGNRCPYTDGTIRGMFYGFSLKHTRAHIYRAILEGIAYGTENIIQQFKTNGFSPKSISVCGGAARSDLFLQIHADVSNLPFHVPSQLEASCLGSAILGAVAAKAYASIQDAAKNMVTFQRVITPNAKHHETYAKIFSQYQKIYPEFSQWMRETSKLAQIEE